MNWQERLLIQLGCHRSATLGRCRGCAALKWASSGSSGACLIGRYGLRLRIIDALTGLSRRAEADRIVTAKIVTIAAQGE